jgi:hypothetical protein
MRKRTRIFLAAVAAVTALVGAGGAVAANADVTQPANTSPSFVVPGDANGAPQSFTIVADGYPQGIGEVSAEVCDGVDPSLPTWSPGLDCDFASATTAVDVGADGKATFPANDPNYGFFPFKGANSVHSWDCMAPGEAPLNNGRPEYTNCQVRVTMDLFNPNANDAFFTMQLPQRTGNAGGQCGGFALLGKASVNHVSAPLLDQTQVATALATSALKNLSTKAVLGGMCSIVTATGDPGNPGGGLVSSLTPKAIGGKVIGNARCASSPAHDGNASHAWPYNGKLTFTMSQTYLDALGHTHAYKIQGDIEILGVDPARGPDVYDVAGVVSAGQGLGATVHGSIWIDPVVAAPKGSSSVYNSGYQFDSNEYNLCNNAIAGDASVSTVMIGGGGSTAVSMRGNSAAGLNFVYNG